MHLAAACHPKPIAVIILVILRILEVYFIFVSRGISSLSPNFGSRNVGHDLQTHVQYVYIYRDLYLSNLVPFLSVYLSICLSVCLSTYLPIYLSTHLPIYLSTYLPIYLSTYLPIYLSTYLPIYLSTYLSIYLSLSLYLSLFLSHCLSRYMCLPMCNIYFFLKIYIYIYIHTNAYIHIYIYIHLTIFMYLYVSIYCLLRIDVVLIWYWAHGAAPVGMDGTVASMWLTGVTVMRFLCIFGGAWRYVVSWYIYGKIGWNLGICWVYGENYEEHWMKFGDSKKNT